MSARQALCLTRLGRPYLLPRQSARRLVPLSEEAVLVGPGVALLSLEGLPAVLVEPDRLVASSAANAEQESATESTRIAPRLALMLESPGDVCWAIAADEVGPADESVQSAAWLDLKKGMTDVESI